LVSVCADIIMGFGVSMIFKM